MITKLDRSSDIHIFIFISREKNQDVDSWAKNDILLIIKNSAILFYIILHCYDIFVELNNISSLYLALIK